jgi:hypothetical protein
MFGLSCLSSIKASQIFCIFYGIVNTKAPSIPKIKPRICSQLGTYLNKIAETIVTTIA